MLTDIEKQVIASIQGDFPVTEQPYKDLAEKIGISEEDFLDALKDLNDRGVIRRFGATLRHQKSGFKSNAMVAWRVDEDRIETVGEKMASFTAVSHCYRRDPKNDWPYNLYTMVHAKNESACFETARQMSEASGCLDYKLLFSRQELKKISMTYFHTDDDD
ncbi:MAG: Lrp/AsnC family transcriptional regulator [Desulfobacterales bacterium]|nr:Lrp/AsnC family transcriptional regulator [Desulfobacterales bacterium]